VQEQGRKGRTKKGGKEGGREGGREGRNKRKGVKEGSEGRTEGRVPVLSILIYALGLIIQHQIDVLLEVGCVAVPSRKEGRKGKRCKKEGRYKVRKKDDGRKGGRW
jgi:hypothetical protein